MSETANEWTAEMPDTTVTEETAASSVVRETTNAAPFSSAEIFPVLPDRWLGYRFIKRTFDILASLTGLIVLSPLFLVLSAVIFFGEGGRPIFHRRRCVGKNGSYDMLKFRTMVKDAYNLERYLDAGQMKAYLRDCKLENDPRITRIGRLLRKTSLDELPQLLNVLKGDMSLVGPRPVVEWEAEAYGKAREKLLSCRPGITGYWQVYGRETNSYDNDERVKMQLYYIDHQSIGLDIRLLFKTVAVVLTGKGAK